MKQLLCFAAILAAPTTAANAQQSIAGASVEHTDFSRGFGQRAIGELNASVRWTDTTVTFDLAHGRRDFGEVDYSGTRVGATAYRDWSERLFTQTTVALASNSPVFPTRRVKQDLNLKVGRDFVASVGIGHNRYYGGRDALTWTAGGSYYFKGGFATYRYSGFDVEKLGRTHGHLATVRLNDGRGRGQSQLWLGTGTALHEFDLLPGGGKGRVRSIALRRLQPLSGKLAFDLNVGRSWYDSGQSDYRGTTVRVGLTLLR